jgi:hypothetical protein
MKLGLLALKLLLTVNKDVVLNIMKAILTCFCSSFIAGGGCNDRYINFFCKVIKLYPGKIYEHPRIVV